MSGEAFATVLTSTSRGAIAVIRVWGPAALMTVDAVFRPRRGRRLAETPPGRPRLGRVGAGEGDEVVAFLVPVEEMDEARPVEVEVHCHGGTAAVALVLAALSEAGARVCESDRWLGRHGQARLTVEAEQDLARAPTLRAAEILLDQAKGSLAREVKQLADLASTDPLAAEPRLSALIDRGEVGLRLVEGWTVALAGRPNVGKSCLLNALAGYERAIVSPAPGTTRDVVTVQTSLDGWAVELADTAGLRPAIDPIECAGIALARRHHEGADLILLVVDRSADLEPGDRELLLDYPDALIVANKCDLPAAWLPASLGSARPLVEVSAQTGQGLDELVQTVARRLVPRAPAAGQAVPFRFWQVRRLEQALALLRGGRTESAARALARLTRSFS